MEDKNKPENCHSWILPKDTIIQYQGVPYYLGKDTEVLGNTDPTIEWKLATDEELRNFFKPNEEGEE